MEDIFLPKPTCVYFIEQYADHLWISGHIEGGSDLEYTNDPIKAVKFITKSSAQSMINALGIGREHIVTEHMFI